MMDFIIDIFMQWFSEGLAIRLFAPLYRKIDKKWPNNKVLKITLSALLIVSVCLLGVAIAFAIVVGLICLIIKLFNN